MTLICNHDKGWLLVFITPHSDYTDTSFTLQNLSFTQKKIDIPDNDPMSQTSSRS